MRAIGKLSNVNVRHSFVFAFETLTREVNP
jgi:hypothetical protein